MGSPNGGRGHEGRAADDCRSQRWSGGCAGAARCRRSVSAPLSVGHQVFSGAVLGAAGRWVAEVDAEDRTALCHALGAVHSPPAPGQGGGQLARVAAVATALLEAGAPVVAGDWNAPAKVARDRLGMVTSMLPPSMQRAVRRATSHEAHGGRGHGPDAADNLGVAGNPGHKPNVATAPQRPPPPQPLPREWRKSGVFSPTIRAHQRRQKPDL